MKKIGVLGGTFDPIHIGHIYIAYEAYITLQLDEVIFMPNGVPPHKNNKNVTDEKIRYAMVEKSISNYSFFTISNYEMKKEGVSFTYETLRYLKNSFMDVEIFFITGADSLINLHTWRNVDDILDLCKLVVFNRPGYKKNQLLNKKKLIEKKYNTNIIYLDLLNLDISSSLIRSRINNSLEVDFFLPRGVLDIIEREELYRKE